MSDFVKSANNFESLDLSDISDVGPDEIEKIVKVRFCFAYHSFSFL